MAPVPKSGQQPAHLPELSGACRRARHLSLSDALGASWSSPLTTLTEARGYLVMACSTEQLHRTKRQMANVLSQAAATNRTFVEPGVASSFVVEPWGARVSTCGTRAAGGARLYWDMPRLQEAALGLGTGVVGLDALETPEWDAGFDRDERFTSALRTDPLLLAWQRPLHPFDEVYEGSIVHREHAIRALNQLVRCEHRVVRRRDNVVGGGREYSRREAVDLRVFVLEGAEQVGTQPRPRAAAHAPPGVSHVACGCSGTVGGEEAMHRRRHADAAGDEETLH